MKKFLILMLVLSFVLCFASCNKEEEQGDNNNPTTTDKTPATTNPIDDISDLDGDNDDNDNYTEIETSSLDIKDIFLCSDVDGNTWKNTFLGLGFKASDSWSFKSDKDLMILNGLNDATDFDEFVEAAEKIKTVCDLYASDATGLNNVTLSTTKMTADDYKAISISEYLEDGIIQRALVNSGYENVTGEYKKVNIGNREVDALDISAEINGNVLYQTYVVFKNEGYLVELAITSSPENLNSQILNNFFWIND